MKNHSGAGGAEIEFFYYLYTKLSFLVNKIDAQVLMPCWNHKLCETTGM